MLPKVDCDSHILFLYYLVIVRSRTGAEGKLRSSVLRMVQNSYIMMEIVNLSIWQIAGIIGELESFGDRWFLFLFCEKWGTGNRKAEDMYGTD